MRVFFGGFLVLCFPLLALANDYWRNLISKTFDVSKYGNQCYPKEPVQVFQPVPPSMLRNFSYLAEEVKRACILDLCPKNKAHTVDAAALKKEVESFLSKNQDFIRRTILGLEKNLDDLIPYFQESLKVPFKELADEEKILALANLQSMKAPEVLQVLEPHEKESLNELKYLAPFLEKQSEDFEKNLRFVESKSLDWQRAELERVSRDLETRYSSQRFWPVLKDQIDLAAVDLEIASRTSYSPFRGGFQENLGHLRWLNQALRDKKSWLGLLEDPDRLTESNRELKDLFPKLGDRYRLQHQNLTTEVNRGVQDCAAETAAARVMALTSQELSGLKSVETKIRESIKEKFFPLLSKRSAHFLNEALANTKVVYPPSAGDVEVAFFARMKHLSSEASTPLKSKSYLTGAYDLRAMVPPNQAILEVCRHGIPDAIGNHAVVSRKEVRLSYDVRPLERGAAAMAHEFTHLMDPDLSFVKLSPESRQKIDKMKACLTAPYGGNEYYLMEDWADAGASLLTANLPYPTRCLLLDYERSWDDIHSDMLFRALHEQVYKSKPMPESCQKIMEKKQSRLATPIKRCFQ